LQIAFNGNLKRLRRKSLLGQLVVLAVAVEILFFGSFIALNLPTASQRNLEHYMLRNGQKIVHHLPRAWQEQILEKYPVLNEQIERPRYSLYVPMAPLAVFLGYTLGAPLGYLAPLLYMLLGVVGARLGIFAFAAGGGLDYYLRPSCGYLFGMMAAGWFAARITRNTRSTLRQVLAVVGGLFLLHLTGLAYLFFGSLGLLMFGESASAGWQPWLFENARNLSWYALPYDIQFSITLIGLGSPFRWLVGVLTAPDNPMKPKPRFAGNLEQVSNV
jgi:biotin transporter BioY